MKFKYNKYARHYMSGNLKKPKEIPKNQTLITKYFINYESQSGINKTIYS